MSCATLKRRLPSDLAFSPQRPGPQDPNGAAKRRRLAAPRLFGLAPTPSPTPSSSPPRSSRNGSPSQSPFGSSSKLSQEQMQTRLQYEIRHLRRLKQFQVAPGENWTGGGAPYHAQNNNGTAFNGGSEFGFGLSKDRPIFSFEQVARICEKMLNEREEALKHEYEKVLSSKLNEQYDTFVKFTQDAIQRQFGAASAPSYLS